MSQKSSSNGQGDIQVMLMEKIKPYKNRILELEKSLSEKEKESIILKLAVERLTEIMKNLQSSGGQKKEGKSGKPGRKPPGRSRR